MYTAEHAHISFCRERVLSAHGVSLGNSMRFKGALNHRIDAHKPPTLIRTTNCLQCVPRKVAARRSTRGLTPQPQQGPIFAPSRDPCPPPRDRPAVSSGSPRDAYLETPRAVHGHDQYHALFPPLEAFTGARARRPSSRISKIPEI